MKTLQDRIWLILLGVVVAVLVTLSTVYWNESHSPSAGSEGGVSRPAGNRAVVPKIVTELSRQLIKPILHSK
jgi:hypothetical protein